MARDWHESWAEGCTGFHRPDVHPQLQAHAGRWLGEGPAKILVPLCGKTVDIGWFLSEGHEVVGVELVPQAVAALHAGLERTPETRPWGRLVAHESPGLTILEGNLLDLQAAHLAGITHVSDPAAILALPPVDRIRYAALLQQHLSPGTQTLLVSFFYDQAHMDGPPYSVPPAELRQLFTPCAAIEALGPAEERIEGSKFVERGLDSFMEQVFLLTR